MAQQELNDKLFTISQEAYYKQEELKRQYANEHDKFNVGDIIKIIPNKYAKIVSKYIETRDVEPHYVYRCYFTRKNGTRVGNKNKLYQINPDEIERIV